MTLTQWSSKLSIYCALGLCLSGCDTKDNPEQSQSPTRPLTSINKSGATSLASATEYKCEYEERFEDGGSKGTQVKLGIAQGKINKLAVSSFITSGEEGGAYMCDINTSEQTVKWSTLNKNSVLNISESVIEIEPMGRAYKIHLAGASRENCGFGAEWPEYVVIEPGNPKCQIKD